jgi:hypothetical protein
MEIIDQLPAVIAASLKIMVLIGLSLYSLFAVIMVRQEHLMDKVIDETFEPVLRILVILHFAASIGLLLFAIFSL